MRYHDIGDLAKGLDPEPDDEKNGCWFLDQQGRCHYEPVVLGYGGPCADCPEEDDAVATLKDDEPAPA